MMKSIIQFGLLFAFILFLTGCGAEAIPPLAVDGKPTLVYLYTEG